MSILLLPPPPTKLDLLNEACHLVPSTLSFYIISSLSAVFRKRLLMKMRPKKKENNFNLPSFFWQTTDTQMTAAKQIDE